MMLAVASPSVLARVRNVPSRAVPALLLFGGIFGAPALLGGLGTALLAAGLEGVGAVLLLLAGVVFFGGVVLAWVSIFSASGRVRRAEQALYAGDFETATREALRVVKTVFRADYQMGALFVLALAAERIGAFAEAGALFARALDAIPAMAAQRPGARARALLAAHAAIDFAAAGDRPRAHAMLSRCHMALGGLALPTSGFGALFDDSYMGSLGINSLLGAFENRRDPRPLAVLASMLVAFKDGQHAQAAQIYAVERPSIEHGLAPNERALAERLQSESMRLTAGAGPHRAAGAIVQAMPGDEWATLVLSGVAPSPPMR
jgi:hypothetical protein